MVVDKKNVFVNRGRIRPPSFLKMHITRIFFTLIVNFYFTAAQLVTETLTQTGLTATGATVLATGGTVTFTPGVSTVTVSIGPGGTVTLGGTSSALSRRYYYLIPRC
jgi:hypothetical protein